MVNISDSDCAQVLAHLNRYTELLTANGLNTTREQNQRRMAIQLMRRLEKKQSQSKILTRRITFCGNNN